jgi:membrane-associated phospholipid phosphatase
MTGTAPSSNDEPAATARDRIFTRLREHRERSKHNFSRLVQIVRKRRINRAPIYPVLDWKMPLCTCLTLVVLCALILDAPVGNFHEKWPAALIDVAEATTRIGLGIWYIVPSIIVLVVANLTDWSRLDRRQLLRAYNWTAFGYFVLIATGLGGLISAIVKNLIGRARPSRFEEFGVFSFHPASFEASFASLPSGHATTMGAVAAIVLLLFPWVRYIAIPATIWVASTRIIVGAHYPSDVAVGFGFGFTFTVLTAIFFARLGYIFQLNATGLPRRKKTFRLLF